MVDRYMYEDDPREPFDPKNNEGQAILVRLAPYIQHGLYKPLQERMEKFVSIMNSKNPFDRGDTRG